MKTLKFNDDHETIDDLVKIQHISEYINTNSFKEAITKDDHIRKQVSRMLNIHNQTYFLGDDIENSHKNVKSLIKRTLLTASKDINICWYSIGSLLDQETVQKLMKYTNNNIRVITDQSQWNSKNMEKYANMLYNEKVQIKHNTKSNHKMHCKFITIDDKFLIFGSMNLGECSLKNYEHITISQDKKTIQAFKDRFNQMFNSKMFAEYYIGNKDDSSTIVKSPIVKKAKSPVYSPPRRPEFITLD